MSPMAKRLCMKSENNCLTFGVGELLWRRPSLAGPRLRVQPGGCVIIFQTCKLETEVARKG